MSRRGQPNESSSNHSLTSSQSNDHGHWKFRDGTNVHDVLGSVDIVDLRAVCDHESSTRWTQIASRNRLYQFIAMSNEATQTEMRQRALSTINATGPASLNDGLLIMPEDGRPRSRGTKRKRSIDDTLWFFDGQQIHQVFQQCSIANLKAICQKFITTSGAKTRTDMYVLVAQAPSPIQEQIRQMVGESMQKGVRLYSRGTASMESDRYETSSMGQASQGCEIWSRAASSQPTSQTTETLLESPFMEPPSRQVVETAIGEFIDRTSNAAVATGICAVCARETNRGELSPHQLDNIPSPHRLQPTTIHPHHDIFNGMLLHPAGVSVSGMANVCVECSKSLRLDKIPTFALANGLWIGDIPHELAYLTLPERLLIAKYIPAAYIIKLYPKKKGARHWDKRQLYSGLKGNVSTYHLDQSQIASMIDGTMMPQQAKVLAATIGITFVGPKNLPDKYLPDMFKVRRGRVRRALEWLKENNPLFANITISESRLADLPENDVPYELQATTKLSTDVSSLYAEQDGYVPVQETCNDSSEGGKSALLGINHGVQLRYAESDTGEDGGEHWHLRCTFSSIPSASHGV